MERRLSCYVLPRLTQQAASYPTALRLAGWTLRFIDLAVFTLRPASLLAPCLLGSTTAYLRYGFALRAGNKDKFSYGVYLNTGKD